MSLWGQEMNTGRKGPPQKPAQHQISQHPTRPPKAGIVQRTTAAARTPTAPPAYRPQPTPKVLQRKTASQPPQVTQEKRTPVAPLPYRPQPLPRVLQAKMAATQSPGTRAGKASVPSSRPSSGSSPKTVVNSARPRQQRANTHVPSPARPAKALPPGAQRNAMLATRDATVQRMMATSAVKYIPPVIGAYKFIKPDWPTTATNCRSCGHTGMAI
jgi:hypothetical protein